MSLNDLERRNGVILRYFSDCGSFRGTLRKNSRSLSHLRLNVRKYAFSNRVIDNWNLLSANCVNCSTINTSKKHLSSELESEAVEFKVSQL